MNTGIISNNGMSQSSIAQNVTIIDAIMTSNMPKKFIGTPFIDTLNASMPSSLYSATTKHANIEPLPNPLTGIPTR